MKAIIQDRYGGPEELRLMEIDRPVPKDDEVSVRVRAAAIHFGDRMIMHGEPKVMRPLFGRGGPRHKVPGSDIAGTVEEVGRGVTRFIAGDEVFGTCHGALAQYACTPEDRLERRPANLTPEEAAAVPTSGLAALHGIRDAGKVRPGQSVLINGASGGVGTFAVQIAKLFGAEVTGVCSTRSVELVRSLGVDHVIDYTVEDFTKGSVRYDLILDCAGNHALREFRRVLTPSGRLIPNSGAAGLGTTLSAFLISPFVRHQGRPYLSMPNPDDLAFLRDLLEDGQLVPVIDRIHHLDEAGQAFAHIDAGHTRGKTVLTA